jgi:methyl-accepting chemotaxis protein
MKEKNHSLRARFVFTFTAFIVIVCVVISFAAVRTTSKIASEIFAEEGNHAIQKVLDLVDGDSFEALSRSLDSSDPFYEETRRKLVELKDFSSCVFLFTMAPVEGTTWQYIIDGSAPPDDKENFSPLGTKEDISGYDDAFFLSWETGTPHNGKLVKQEGWGWLISTYAVIKNSAGKSVGLVGIDFQAEHLVRLIVRDILIHAIIGLCSVIAGLGILFIFLRMIFTRLTNINVMLKEISEGEGNLTGRIAVERRDEIGQLAEYFNLTLDKIKNLVVTIKDQTANLHGVGGELSSNMENTAMAIRQISSNIEDIKTMVIHQSASVNETGATMEKVTQNICNLNDRVTEQAGNVSRSSSAIEEMLANIQSVTQTLMQNADNVRDLIAASESGRGGLEAVSRDIQEIARESEGLLQINAVMQNIASQTNLLSMNAAIEAAHAGEIGKGFAVVADEIRKLAENSSKQSKTISTVLKKIKNAIDGITASANAVQERFGAINEKVGIVSGEETKIRRAMEAQGQGSQELLKSIAQLNEITRLVQSGSEEMLTGSREVIKESENLVMLSNEITTGMNEMSSGADQINTAVNRVNGISAANKEHIDSLVMEVSRFMVD